MFPLYSNNDIDMVYTGIKYDSQILPFSQPATLGLQFLNLTAVSTKRIKYWHSNRLIILKTLIII